LVAVVYEANLDPLPIMDLTDCVQELRRRGIALPERGPWDTDPIYREMCQKVNFLAVTYSIEKLEKNEERKSYGGEKTKGTAWIFFITLLAAPSNCQFL
jgi:hypothetical protein